MLIINIGFVSKRCLTTFNKFVQLYFLFNEKRSGSCGIELSDLFLFEFKFLFINFERSDFYAYPMQIRESFQRYRRK